MTFLVDRRKDNYDELLVLARDARQSRARANRWSAALVASAIVGTGAYVASMNEQVDDLRDEAKQAVSQRDSLVRERDALQAEMQALSRYQTFYADVAPTFELAEQVRDFTLTLPTGPGDGPVERVISETKFGLSNLVWIVNGSRRFPITDGDILWIPEGKFWVELESADAADGTDPLNAQKILRKVSIVRDAESVTDREGSKEFVLLGGRDRFYEEPAPWATAAYGNANCIRMTLHDKSLRSGFEDPKYLDMEVLLYNNRNCGTGLVTP